MPPSLWLEAFLHSYTEHADVFDQARELHGKGYRTGILSNTEKPARPLLDHERYRIFDPIVLSWAAGTSKPQRQIFEVLIETLSLDPHEVLFIDDAAANVAAARDAGIGGLLFTDAETLRKDLARLL
jgi:HAD superfamily hydrolase (TIGR01509 family)